MVYEHDEGMPGFHAAVQAELEERDAGLLLTPIHAYMTGPALMISRSGETDWVKLAFDGENVTMTTGGKPTIEMRRCDIDQVVGIVFVMLGVAVEVV